MVVSFTFNYVQLSCQRNGCPYCNPSPKPTPHCAFAPRLAGSDYPRYSLLFCGCIALRCAERAEPHVHWASLRRQISMNCLISETSAGILAAVDGRVVKNLKVRWKFAKGRGGQIVVVSLRNARAAKGRCRVRIRRAWRRGKWGGCGEGSRDSLRHMCGCLDRNTAQHSKRRCLRDLSLYSFSCTRYSSSHLTSLSARTRDFSIAHLIQAQHADSSRSRHEPTCR
jgi:hypothetical protein